MSQGAQLAILLHVVAAAAIAAVQLIVRPPAPERLAGRAGPIALLGRFAYFVSGPVVRALRAFGVTANGVTSVGLVLNLAAGLAASAGEWGWAGLLLVWGSWCDLVDGALARATRTQSAAGAFLDSNLDRVSEIALFAGLAAAFPDRAGAGWAIAALSASLMVSYTRARGEGLGVTCPTFGLERPHRLVLAMAALLVAPFLRPEHALLALEGLCAFVAVGAGATALGRLVVIHQLLRRAGAPAASAPGAPPPGTP